MQRKILDDLEDLLAERVIDQSTANNIRQYYLQREGQQKNRQFVIFGILGSLLIGLGIILIVAHNWDNLSRTTKTVIGFAPLLLAQALGFITIIKWQDSRTWKESAATLLVFGLGATLSLISQIYHLPGTLSSFVLTWMLLVLPIMYLFPSTMAAVLYLLGITYYGADIGYGADRTLEDFYYWFLLLPLLPYYLDLLKNQSKSNFTYLLNWLIPISLIVNLGTIAHDSPEWLFTTYLSLFGIYYIIGKNIPLFKNNLQNNGYRALGSIGTVVLLTALSFQWIWKELAQQEFRLDSPEAIVTIILISILTGLILKFQDKKRLWTQIDPTPFIAILFLVLFIGFRSTPTISVIVINIVLFLLALYTIQRAMQLQHLGLLNYGLLMITALIICRFFDTNISFILRGLLFVLIGIGFFIANYKMIKASP